MKDFKPRILIKKGVSKNTGNAYTAVVLEYQPQQFKFLNGFSQLEITALIAYGIEILDEQ